MSENNPLLQRAYALDGDRKETRRVYADWASRYDHDTVNGMGYVAPERVATELAALVPKDARILDAGCGTGLAGSKLNAVGFTHIDGIDLSREMLEVARGKDVYLTLAEADMSRPLDISGNSYDAVVSVGVFTSGHVKPDALEELARVTRSKGVIVVTVHEKVWDTDGYPAYLENMASRGIARTRTVNTAPYHEKEGYQCQLCVLEVL